MAQRDVMRTMSLNDGAVVVRGPEGYCIDRRSVRSRSDESFVLLASCEALSGVRGQQVEPVIMTLTVLPRNETVTLPSAGEIAASMSGFSVVDVVEMSELNLVHFANGGDGVFPGMDPRHWRGAMVLNGHLIGLALYASKDGASAGMGGQDLLARLAANTTSMTPARSGVSAEATEEAATETSNPPPGFFGALLGGLFPDSS